MNNTNLLAVIDFILDYCKGSAKKRGCYSTT